MNSKRDTEFRLKLAAGFLMEAEEDVRLSRWRSCVDNAQMAAENAAKAVIAMRGPVPKVHQLHRALSRLSKNAWLSKLSTEIAALGEITEKLGFESIFGPTTETRVSTERHGKSLTVKAQRKH